MSARAAVGGKRRALGASSTVAFGILLSRIVGFVRERVFAYYFGVHSISADAFRSAIRIPSLLSTLFGEGVLSASFVTVYAKLRAQGQDREAEDVAAGVFGILSLVRRPGLTWRQRHSALHRRHRPRLSRSKANSDHPFGSHFVPSRRLACDERLVFGRLE
jgi:hypothetical protein